MAMSSSLIREAGGREHRLGRVTVPVSWMWTLWSGMVSSTWMGVVFEKSVRRKAEHEGRAVGCGGELIVAVAVSRGGRRLFSAP